MVKREMSQYFSIRSYTKIFRSHYHEYHQLVLPLHGVIDIRVGKFSGLIGVGDCVIIRAGELHEFSAHEAARFIVVDMPSLPGNIMQASDEKITIDSALLSFTQFLEQQLNSQINQAVEQSAFELFYQLLSQQKNIKRVDKRLEPVLAKIHDHLSDPLIIDELAKLACLSATQFKVVFKQSLEMTVQQYIRQCRMHKAKALITHTDMPIAIVAVQVGYQDSSAFSRQFKSFFGHSPTQ